MKSGMAEPDPGVSVPARRLYCERAMSAGEDRPASSVVFGPFEFDPTSLELRRGTESVRLPYQPARLLAFLLRQAGRVVTREEVRKACWPETVHGAGPAINAAVRQIRRALGDEGSRSRYIETLPRRGYRFIAPVTSPGESAVPPARLVRRLALPALLSAAIVTWVVAVRPRADADFLRAPGSVRLSYARAVHLLDSEEPESLKRGLDLFRAVVAAEPGFAPARAGEAEAWLRLGEREKARVAAGKAIELAPDLARAHHVLGLVRLFEDWDSAGAERSLRRAVRLDPADVRHRVSLAYLLVSTGRRDEAVEILDRLHAVDPIEPAIRGDAGYVYYLARRYPRALEMCETASELDPRAVWAEDCVQNALVGLGRYDEAAGRVEAALRRWGIGASGISWTPRQTGRERLRAYWGWRARRLAKRGASGWHYLLASLYADLDRRAESLAELELAAEERSMSMVALAADPRFERWRGDPRLETLLARLSPT